jgi:aspartate kinase
MALIVQKYGGTSVGGLDQIHRVADKIIQAQQAGHKLVVVVSAMAGETDRLVDLAQSFRVDPDPRALAILLSTGEQKSIALLNIALAAKGCATRAYTGAQLPILTDSAYNRANIVGIDTHRIQADLAAGYVVVVAGFQGVDSEGTLTTLGRGGSDTTAVALAAALEADECQIYTDVEGIYTVDPRIVSVATPMSEIGLSPILEMASSGAKVMQNRALEWAGRYQVPLRVLSTFHEGSGTVILTQGKLPEHPVVSGIAFSRDEAHFFIGGIPQGSSVLAQLLLPLSEAHIEIDMMVQSLQDDHINLGFSVHQRDVQQTLRMIQAVATRHGAGTIRVNSEIAKLAVVGVGVRSDLQVLATMLRVLAEASIPVLWLCASEMRLCVLIDRAFLSLGLRLLEQAFFSSVQTMENHNSQKEKEKDDVNFNQTCG